MTHSDGPTTAHTHGGHRTVIQNLELICFPAIPVGLACPHLIVTGEIFGDILTTQRLTDYIYLGPYPSREGRSRLDEGIYRFARILRASKISTKSLKDYYLGLNPGMRRPDLLDAPMPPTFKFQGFTIGGKAHKLEYTKRMITDHLYKAVVMASMKTGSQAGEPDIAVVKSAHLYCKAA